jgi:hypothetical protein
MRTVTTVFLSSTARDLTEYRDRVYAAISGLDDYKCIRMEDFGARARDAADFCRDKVRECDLLVGIVGHLYGSTPQGSEQSYTEIEYESAAPENRLMFLADEDLPPPAVVIAPESDDQRRRVQEFRGRVSKDAIRSSFRTPDELATRVLQAIQNWERSSPTRMVEALPALMRDPTVHDAVVGSRDKFDHAAEQIEKIAAFKSVHDALHQLEFNCLRMLINKSARFEANDPVFLAELEHYGNSLDEISKKLPSLVAGDAFAGQDMKWLVALESARTQLGGAVEQSDKKRLDDAIRHLNRVVAKLPQINSELIHAVRDLDLKQLLTILIRIREKLPSLKLDDELRRRFDHGVAGLEDLNEKLEALSDTHDRWQEVDCLLRLIEGARDDLVEQLKVNWSELQGLTDSLLSQHAEFAKLSRKLEDALAGQNDTAIRSAFLGYRSRAGTEFYGADVDLLKVCEELRLLEKPLQSVLEMR